MLKRLVLNRIKSKQHTESYTEFVTYGVRAIGVGTGGGRMVANVNSEDYIEKAAIISSWDEAAELSDHVDKVIRVGSVLGGMGCSKDPELGKKIAKNVERAVKRYSSKISTVFGALGGGTFTGYAISMESPPDILIVSLPKEEEGKKRATAHYYLPEVIEKAKNVAVLDPEIEYPNGDLKASIGDPRFLHVNAFASVVPNIIIKTLKSGSWDVGDIKRRFNGIISVTIAKNPEDFEKLNHGWPTVQSIENTGTDVEIADTADVAILLTPWNEVEVEAEDTDIIHINGEIGYGIAFYDYELGA